MEKLVKNINKKYIHKKKRLKFKKNISTIFFPFLLDNFSPWQDQIKKEIKKIESDYIIGKSVRRGFEIGENGVWIKYYKNN